MCSGLFQGWTLVIPFFNPLFLAFKLFRFEMISPELRFRSILLHSKMRRCHNKKSFITRKTHSRPNCPIVMLSKGHVLMLATKPFAKIIVTWQNWYICGFVSFSFIHILCVWLNFKRFASPTYGPWMTRWFVGQNDLQRDHKKFDDKRKELLCEFTDCRSHLAAILPSRFHPFDFYSPDKSRFFKCCCFSGGATDCIQKRAIDGCIVCFSAHAHTQP